MNIQWVGVLPFSLFILQSLFTLSVILILNRTIRIISSSFKKRTNTNIFKPLFFLFSYSLLCILFKQAISLNMINFLHENTEFFINLAISLIHVVVALELSFKILNHSNFTDGCVKYEKK